MLQQLLKYAERESIVSEPGFAAKEIHYALNISEEGTLGDLIPLGEPGKGKRYARCPNLSQPEMIRGGEQRSQFLVESLSALLLLTKTEDEQAKMVARRAYFVKLLRSASAAFPSLEVLGRCADYLENESERVRLHGKAIAEKLKLTDQVALWWNHQDLVAEEAWVDWWRQFRGSLAENTGKKSDGVAGQMRDLLTGEMAEPARTHFKIKGLAGIGGLGTGDSLASFDKSAFQSFQLDQSLNAAMSEVSARLYADALNELLVRSQKFAKTKICHWFSRKIEDDPFDFAVDPRAEEIGFSDLIARLRSGLGGRDEPTTLFYCLSLSGCSGRVMVRDWQEGNLHDLRENVARWYEDNQIVSHRDGELARSPKLFAVVASLYREAEDIVDNLALQVFRAATLGGEIPLSCMAQALHRFKVDLIKEQSFHQARMGLMRAYFQRKKGGFPLATHLALDHPEPAYHCGRLLAVLSLLQTRALGDVGAGVVQRFYGATSQAPALTFGRLLAGSQHHLNKLDSPGLRHWFESLIGEIVTSVGPSFPKSLSLEKQALFALGYYQQIAQNQKKHSPEKATEVQ